MSPNGMKGILMRNFIKFLIMMPFVLGSMILSAMLVGLSVAFDSIDQWHRENNGHYDR